MTAIVGILNRNAVAIAADSAATFGNTHKVVNSANKIFTLSKYHPIAVMTYNCAAFMGVPWEIIIKEYRKELAIKSYPHVKDYMDNFLEFLSRKSFFCNEEIQGDFLVRCLISFFNELCYRDKFKRSILNKDDKSINDSIKELLSNVTESLKSADRCPEFKEYTEDNFVEYSKTYMDVALSKIKEEIEKVIGRKFEIDIKDLFAKAFYTSIVTKKIATPFYTGLVFVGYGDNDIFPSLVPLNISVVFDNHLKYFIGEEAKISANGPDSMVCPFAQTDVIRTIMEGINPQLSGIINRVMINSVNSFYEELARILSAKNIKVNIPSIISDLKAKDIVKAAISSMNESMKNNYTNPLLQTISNLDKQDLANMAESFIALTSLVRRMQPGEETVGGPIDVAVISKGDGFVWINRKHYFKPEFNHHFFHNYYQKEASHDEE